ncbi:4-(cytidine 5'-diphospho)-2-C-methyl-D-erythritol kinase [Alphaproteobacteria bacterium HT1-32]|nr:4-(cytidine 5'-diphospho)-2-C-methyl-D-erythritol kinase [Alphaproteobacteria bacterium HT1-32]
MVDSALVTEFAAAKINLWLHVTGRREDGYHLLDSLIAFAGVGDRLTLTRSDDLSLSLTGPFSEGLTTTSDNLVIRAATLLASEAGIRPAAAITLEKNLPVASGIGGGSADAAAAIRGLSKLWNLSLPTEVTARIALRLGADVPMCLAGQAALASGIGEVLHPVGQMAPAWLVLVNPRVAISTPEIFRLRENSFTDITTPAAGKLATLADLTAALRERHNDLQPPAIRLAPVIGEVLERLRGLSGCQHAAMSGSGATCFGLFEDRQTAEQAAGSLSSENSKWWSAAAPLLSDAIAQQTIATALSKP